MKDQILDSHGILTREQAEKILKPHLSNIQESIRSGWRMWKRFEERDPESTKPLSSTTRAGYVHDHIIDEVKRLFSDGNGGSVVDGPRYVSLLIKDRIVLRFKKLDNNLHPSGILTQHFREFLTQRDLPELEHTGLIAGYRLDMSETEIAGIHVICPVGYRRNGWVLDLGADSSTTVAIHQPQSGGNQSVLVLPIGNKERRNKDA